MLGVDMPAMEIPSEPMAQVAVSGRDDPAQESGRPASRSLAQLESSQNAMRDTTKWLVAATAAVGAVVVAGLQLSTIPHGRLATTLALGGFALAIVGVSFILIYATRVLSSGYTTFGELADLKNRDAYEVQLTRAKYWNDRNASWEDRIYKWVAVLKGRPGHNAAIPVVTFVERTCSVVIIPCYWMIMRALRITAWTRVRHAKSEGVRIEEMLHELKRDTLFFSYGIAKDIPDLSEQLENTDRDILVLRGERVPRAEELPLSEPGQSEKVAAVAGEIRALGWLEWRQNCLELATSQLIAFANQKLIEHKFNQLKIAVQIGGLAVVVGVGCFVAAPKFAKMTPLPIMRTTPVSIRVVGNKFGAGCPSGTLLQGVAIGGTWTNPIVVTKTNGACTA